MPDGVFLEAEASWEGYPTVFVRVKDKNGAPIFGLKQDAFLAERQANFKFARVEIVGFGEPASPHINILPGTYMLRLDFPADDMIGQFAFVLRVRRSAHLEGGLDSCQRRTIRDRPLSH